MIFPYKLLLCCALVLGGVTVGAAFGVKWEKGQQAVRDLEIANQQALIFAKHRNTERGWMDDVSKAQTERASREKILKADVDAVRAERDGLRNDIASIDGRIATASVDAVRKYATTVNNVFEQCTREYQDMAEAADGHAADSLTLQKAWPTRK